MRHTTSDMVTPEQLQQLSDLTTSAHSIVVLVSNKATADEISAAYGLTTALQSTGKEVLFAGPQPLNAPEYLGDIPSYTTTLGNRNLVVSFEYHEEAVENVSYHIGEDSGKFFLTIKPQKGHKPLDASKVEFSYAGTEADLVFLVGVSSYDALEDIYVANERLFTDAAVVSLHSYATDIGQIKLDSSGEPSLCTMVATIIRHFNWQLPTEGATALLAGVEQATNNFKSFSTTPETLELAAWLMRCGARRVWRGEAGPANGAVTTGDSQAFAEVFSKKSTEGEKPAKRAKKGADKKLGGLDHDPGMSISTK